MMRQNYLTVFVKGITTWLSNNIKLIYLTIRITFITTQIDKNIDFKGMHRASLALQRYVSKISNGALQLLDKLDALSMQNVVWF